MTRPQAWNTTDEQPNNHYFYSTSLILFDDDAEEPSITFSTILYLPSLVFPIQ
jgi:hypothetical protein